MTLAPKENPREERGGLTGCHALPRLEKGIPDMTREQIIDAEIAELLKIIGGAEQQDDEARVQAMRELMAEELEQAGALAGLPFTMAEAKLQKLPSHMQVMMLGPAMVHASFECLLIAAGIRMGKLLGSTLTTEG